MDTYSQLLLDRFQPHYDIAVVHSRVLRAPPDVCYSTLRDLDFFRAPLIRTLIDLRGLPQRLASTRARRGDAAAAEPARNTFRLIDMVDRGWILLGETPGVELVLGQVSRPWQAGDRSTETPRTPSEYIGFDQPGFAKIATTVRVDPYGAASSIVTVETRVALTDDESRRRFKRYWIFVGPFSALIRRTALRLLATELSRRDSQSAFRERKKRRLGRPTYRAKK